MLKTIRLLGVIFIISIWLSALWAENPHQDRVPTLLPFANQQMLDSTLVPVEFEFHHTLAATDSGVGINGSFNGWGDVFKCQNVGGDTWIRVLYLRPGQYQYKFVTYVDTVGQAGVTGWYTDALNPIYGGPYRDSYITVKNPMIYYFLPLEGSETNLKRPEISAKMSAALKNQLQPESIAFSIDGTSISDPASYFNVDSKKFKYLPPEDLAFGEHVLTLRVENNEGVAASAQTQFNLLRGIIEAPFTLTFDSQSPMLELIDPVKGVVFEWRDDVTAETLYDPDADGIFEKQLNLRVNKDRIYRVIINNSIYLEADPTNPIIGEEWYSVVRKTVDPRPRFIDFSPAQGSVFTATDTTVTFSARIVPSDSNYAIQPESIVITLDNQPVNFTYEAQDDTISVRFNATLGHGWHQLFFSARDQANMTSLPVYLTAGAYPANSGFHYVDAVHDDNGYGSYLYPTDVASQSADIQAVHIDLNETMDSLLIHIDMANISDFTRLGLAIANTLDGKLVELPDNLELRLPNWQDQGIYAILAAPDAATLRAGLDNQVFSAHTPLSSAFTLAVNPDARASRQFRLKFAIADLEQFLGTFNQSWYFSIFSYLARATGSIEISRTDGGVREAQDPDVYDLAFCSGLQTQNLLLKNYITSIAIGGPRLAAIGRSGRGTIELSGQDLNANFKPAPMVKLLARGGKIYWDSVQVVGTINDPVVLQTTLQVNLEQFTVPVVNGTFAKTIRLNPGLNSIRAQAMYGANQTTYSQTVHYEYVFNYHPIVKISTQVQNGKLSLDGSASYHPLGWPLTFVWEPDPTNPVPVQLAPLNQAATQVDAPSVPGEYYFTLKAKAGDYTGWARTVVVVDDKARTVDLTTWHPAWVDSMILYEIFTRTFSVTGKLNAVKGRMSMLRDLGINCIWFMPLHPTPATHGYWITDYYDINPEHGTLEDFRQVVEEAHKYGIKVIMDLVINHTVDVHPFMRDALENGINSPYRDFYYWDAQGNFQYLYTWFNLPSINFSTPWVRDYLIDMCKWWVQNYNIDGFRCDVAHAIEERRPEGPAFWQRWRQELKEMKPDIFLLAEAAASDPRYFNGKFDSGYDYWLYNGMRNALTGTATSTQVNDIVMHYLDNVPAHARPMRYIENHDESRFLDNFSLGQTRTAAMLDFTLPGIPLIYAGQEVGELSSRGLVRWGDPNQLKPFYERLVRIRKGHPALMQGRYLYLPSENNHIFAFLRKNADETLLVISNFSETEQAGTIKFPLAELPFDTLTSFYLNDLLTDTYLGVTGANLLRWDIALAGHQSRVYQLASEPTGISSGGVTPYQFGIEPNFPNPFNANTSIRYTVGGQQPVLTQVEIYNILGQKIKTLVHQRQAPGQYQVLWKGDNESGVLVGSGVYFVRFRSGDYVRGLKVLLLK